MQPKNNTVVTLPTELFEMREAAKLVKEWGRIQQISALEVRTAELAKWRRRMFEHLDVFTV